jgi:hypothetical protein
MAEVVGFGAALAVSRSSSDLRRRRLASHQARAYSGVPKTVKPPPPAPPCPIPNLLATCTCSVAPAAAATAPSYGGMRPLPRGPTTAKVAGSGVDRLAELLQAGAEASCDACCADDDREVGRHPTTTSFPSGGRWLAPLPSSPTTTPRLRPLDLRDARTHRCRRAAEEEEVRDDEAEPARQRAHLVPPLLRRRGPKPCRRTRTGHASTAPGWQRQQWTLVVPPSRGTDASTSGWDLEADVSSTAMRDRLPALPRSSPPLGDGGRQLPRPRQTGCASTAGSCPVCRQSFFLSPFFIEAFAAWRCGFIAGDSLTTDSSIELHTNPNESFNGTHNFLYRRICNCYNKIYRLRI